MSSVPPPIHVPTNRQNASGLSIYVCAALMLVPTLVVIVTCLTVLIPKLRLFQQHIAALPDHNSQSIGVWMGINSTLLTALPALVAALTVLFVVCEICWSAWPQWRSWIVLGSATLINGLAVLFIAWIAIITSIAGPLAGIKIEKKRAAAEQTGDQKSSDHQKASGS